MIIYISDLFFDIIGYYVKWLLYGYKVVFLSFPYNGKLTLESAVYFTLWKTAT